MINEFLTSIAEFDGKRLARRTTRSRNSRRNPDLRRRSEAGPPLRGDATMKIGLNTDGFAKLSLEHR